MDLMVFKPYLSVMNCSSDMQIVRDDPWLKPVAEQVKKRYNRYLSRLQEVEDLSGSLESFALAYQYLGIHFDPIKNGWYYREWAPAARALYLTGDFNHWEPEQYPLKRNHQGFWELFLPAPTLQHGDRIKVVVDTPQGRMLRIPAWIQRVVQDPDTKNFDGQIWVQPQSKPKQAFVAREPLLIYECHIGMAQEQPGVGSYEAFEQQVLPRIAKAGYTAIQLMAIQEHPYYGSFGYQVSNFFAASSRFGPPEALKKLIDTAHQMGIAVIMDLVHAHTVKNLQEGITAFDGTDTLYFPAGERGRHPDWDSRIFDYGKLEVLRFLLSNIRYWMDEYHFDGFRFDGVGSMLYQHHGKKTMRSPEMYFDETVEQDAVTYLQLANTLIHRLNPHAITIAEEVTGMPGLTATVEQGGFGFDLRLGMGLPDFWIQLLKEKADEQWSMKALWEVLNDRKKGVKTVAYCESHDQALVGDQTLAFRLMGSAMYHNMATHRSDPVIDRGMALHKLIRFFTLVLGGQAYLNFMGNEFGHPEWIDFPRAGNKWSYHFARRQWSLVDHPGLRYRQLGAFDRAMLKFAKQYTLLGSGYGEQLLCDESNKTIVFRRADLIFVFNFHPQKSLEHYRIPVIEHGVYQLLFHSDKAEFGGHDRLDQKITYPAGRSKESKDAFLRIYNTNRTVQVFGIRL